MARRSYRVVKSFPWIVGGRPLPGFGWEGGQGVVYEPGDLFEVDDEELPTVYRRLEGIDDAGRTAIAVLRAKAEAPARITLVADLHPRTIDWLGRALDEKLRLAGRMRELCIRMIARGDHPTDDDLAAAFEESPGEPVPRELHDYCLALEAGQVRRKSGPKAARTTAADILIKTAYLIAVKDLRAHYARRRQKQAPVKRRAAEEVAERFGLSVRTVERIVAPRPWTKDDKGAGS